MDDPKKIFNSFLSLLAAELPTEAAKLVIEHPQIFLMRERAIAKMAEIIERGESK
jgi:hypothetical protein